MTNELSIFDSEFGKVRTVSKGDTVWFVGNDVAKCLGYTDYKHATDKVFSEYKLSGQIDHAGQMRKMTLVNEFGVYQLVFGSKLPNAVKFQKWVFEEVLPSIRKNGGYISESASVEQVCNLVSDFRGRLIVKNKKIEALECEVKLLKSQEERTEKKLDELLEKNAEISAMKDKKRKYYYR